MVLIQAAEISFQTFLKAFVVHGIIFATFIFMAYKILKRDRKWINLLISGFYICVILGFFFNFLFVLLSFDPNAGIVLILYYITMFFLLLGVFFLTIFTYLLLKTESLFTKQKQLISLVIYGILVALMAVIPNGIKIDSSTNWNPVYSLYYFLYIIILFTVTSVLPQTFCFFKVYNAFSQEELQKRWKYFGIGVLCCYILCYGTVIYNFLDIYIIRLIFGFVSLGCAVASAILIYYGIAKL